MKGDTDLLEIVRTLHTSRRFARCLNRGEKQTDQNTDDRNNDQQLNQGKTLVLHFFHKTPYFESLIKRTGQKSILKTSQTSRRHIPSQEF